MMIPVGIELTCYYYSFLFATTFLYSKRKEAGAILLGHVLLGDDEDKWDDALEFRPAYDAWTATDPLAAATSTPLSRASVPRYLPQSHTMTATSTGQGNGFTPSRPYPR